MSRLVVVSNRVAVPQKGRRNAAGGLAVAVNAALQDEGGIWFGWSGRIAESPSPQPAVSSRGRTTFAVVDLTAEDHQEYYNGYANRVLWPILHYRLDLAEFQRSDLSGYLRVNRLFAEQLSRFLEPDDVVWVHDYHLMPLARYLRELGVRNRIGFFLHIPMPPPDILKALPRHGEIIGALAAFDVVGFQTRGDRDNFARYLAERGGAVAADGARVRIEGHQVTLGVYPAAIDTKAFGRLARRAARTRFRAQFRESLLDRQLIVGVDRLDYTKGIANRLDAYERLLDEDPERRGRVSYVQIAPLSRTDVPEYQDMDNALSQKAGQINGRYGDVSWTPLRYVNRTYSRSALASIYREADVAMVTPLRDGMNLVAKEFVAAQNPDDPGVLVLSQFAGAAQELAVGALIVNPHDPESITVALRRALDMPVAERRERHQRMMAVLDDYDIDRWAKSFLKDLCGTGGQEEAAPRLQDRLVRAAWALPRWPSGRIIPGA